MINTNEGILLTNKKIPPDKSGKKRTTDIIEYFKGEGILRINTFSIYYFRWFLNFNRIIFRL